MATDVNLKPPIPTTLDSQSQEGQLSEHSTLESSVIGRLGQTRERCVQGFQRLQRVRHTRIYEGLEHIDEVAV